MNIPRDVVDTAGVPPRRSHVENPRNETPAGIGAGDQPRMPGFGKMIPYLREQTLDGDVSVPGSTVMVNEVHGGRMKPDT
jgi:hypothetical protein